ncbi:S8 family serine peptidase [Mycoplasma procyoni]|uniref:S8 family serine peptidase n=1 Tax=Mycoplasma procyoni TaxID=568784 RepID=UPI00197C5377|nr:S8 family serine peptidase [Mycoplasma procyoni]MBN3534737.1 S8 family serine peptidase [Mycoplasma procyoni]
MKKSKKSLFWLSSVAMIPLSTLSFVGNSQQNKSETKEQANNFNIYDFIDTFLNYTKGENFENEKVQQEDLEKFSKSLNKNKEIKFYINYDVDEKLNNLEKINFYTSKNKEHLEKLLNILSDKIEVKSSFSSELINTISIEVEEKDLEQLKDILKNTEFENYLIKDIIASMDIQEFKQKVIDSFCLDRPDANGNCATIWKKPKEINTKPKQQYSTYSTPKVENEYYYLKDHEYKNIFKKELDFIGDIKDESKVKIDKKTNKPVDIYRTKVGIWESNKIQNHPNFKFNNLNGSYDEEKLKNDSYSHKFETSSLAVGLEGVDTFAELFDIDPGYMYNGKLLRTIKISDDKTINVWKLNFYSGSTFEKNILSSIKQGVEVINASFGLTNTFSESIHYYDDFSYFLDKIVNDYKVVFVFSAGNSKNKTVNTKLESMKLTMNAFKVGAFDMQYKSGATNFSTDDSTDEYFETDFPNITVSAPGNKFYFSKISKNLEDDIAGTSFSSPLVAGVISKLIRNSEKIRKKPASIFSIIGASSVKFNNWKKDLLTGNDYSKSTGSGIINYKRALKAIENLNEYKINSNLSNGKIDDTVQEINLKSGQSITISAAWLFKGFKNYSKNNKLLKENNGKDYFKNQLQLHQLTDFNIEIELWDSNQKKWNKIKSTSSKNANKEILKLDVEKNGKYRFYIVKNSTNTSVENDEVALSYLVD